MGRKRKPASSPATTRATAAAAAVGWWRCPVCGVEVSLAPRDRSRPPGCLDCLFGPRRDLVEMEPAHASPATTPGGAR